MQSINDACNRPVNNQPLITWFSN